jgi:hypothetical protein
VCLVLCNVFRLIVVLFCVMCVICVLCLIVVPLPPGTNQFAVKRNNNKIRISVRFPTHCMTYADSWSRQILPSRLKLVNNHWPNIAVENVELLFRISEVLGSNLGPRPPKSSYFAFVSSLREIIVQFLDIWLQPPLPYLYAT